MTSRSTKDTSRITLLDVAERAGVSRATASLVVRKSPLVGCATREKVESAIKALGYVYNGSAARLRRGTSHTVGVLVPNLSNPFFAHLLAGIESVLDAEGLAVMLANTQEDPTRQEAFVKRMREHGVDGLIICAASQTGAHLADAVERYGLATVQALRRLPDVPLDYAGTDYAGGMQAAVEHLKTLGHRRLLYVAGNRHHSAYSDRLAGFTSALDGVESGEVVEIALTHSAGRAAARTVVTHPSRPTAALCFNDVVALGLLRGFYDEGVDVGEEFSLVGFDDVPEAALARPALTSVATRPVAIGENAARLLLKRLADPDAAPRHLIEPTHLVARGSTRCPSIGCRPHRLTAVRRGFRSI